MFFRFAMFALFTVLSGMAVAQSEEPKRSYVSVEDNSPKWSVFVELRHHGYDSLRYDNNANNDLFELYQSDGLTDNDIVNGTLGVNYRVMPKLEVQLTRTEGVDNWGDGCCSLLWSSDEITDILIDYTTVALNYQLLGGGRAGSLNLTGGIAFFDVEAEFSLWSDDTGEWITTSSDTFNKTSSMAGLEYRYGFGHAVGTAGFELRTGYKYYSYLSTGVTSLSLAYNF